MSTLDINPAHWPGTPEWEEVQQQRRLRLWQGEELAIEQMLDDYCSSQWPYRGHQ